MEPIRHLNNSKITATIFRRTLADHRKPGGVWEESKNLYWPIGGVEREFSMDWTFPQGLKVRCAHLEDDKALKSYQGSQIPILLFDEVTHFTERQFFYMLSRNRSTSGIRPYVRATCNPDPDSWLRRFIDWWIDKDGFADPARSGKLRWFIRVNDSLQWADSKEELVSKFGSLGEFAKSVTFIPSKLSDNKILEEKDPGYRANLMALSYVERMQLLGDDERGGNWNIRAAAGNLFRREWFRVIDTLPANPTGVIRFWDRAATKPSPGNPDPGWTRGLRLHRYSSGIFVIADLRSLRDTPGQVETLIKNTASQDGRSVRIRCQRDPGSAGVSEAEYFSRMLAGYDVGTTPFSKNKETRAKPVSAQAQAGNVWVLRAPWNEEFFRELEAFPDGKHDDSVDALSGAFNEMCDAHSTMDLARRSR